MLYAKECLHSENINMTLNTNKLVVLLELNILRYSVYKRLVIVATVFRLQKHFHYE